VLLADISTRVSALDSSLDCGAGPAVAGVDELGPIPATCLPDGSTTTAPGGDGSTAGPEVPGSTSAPLPTPLPGSSAPSAGGGVPGVPGVPGMPGVPGVPGVPGLPSGSGGGGILPTPAVPSLPTGVLPTPTPTLPSPSVSVPRLPRLPGTTGIPVPSAVPLDTPDACLGPVAIGDC
jgi:hypothetical protein